MLGYEYQYIFEAIIKAPRTQEDLLEILETGINLGFRYYDTYQKSIFNAQEATMWLLNPNEATDNYGVLLTKFKEIFINIIFEPYDDSTKIIFLVTRMNWTRMNINSPEHVRENEMDTRRYTDLLLAFCNQFKLLQIKVYKHEE